MNILNRVLKGRVSKQTRDSSLQARHTQRKSPRPRLLPVSNPSQPSTSVYRSSRIQPVDKVRVKQEEDDIESLDSCLHVKYLAHESQELAEDDLSQHERAVTRNSSPSEDCASLEDDEQTTDSDPDVFDSFALPEDLQLSSFQCGNYRIVPSIEQDDHDQLPQHLSSESLSHRRSRLRLARPAHQTAVAASEPADVDNDAGPSIQNDLAEDIIIVIDEADMQEYQQAMLQTPGMDNWTAEARLLHKLLYLRGLYPLMPSDWRLWDLRDHPLPAELFMRPHQDHSALVRAEKNQYHATKALRGLFGTHVLVRAYRQGGQHNRIASLISRQIKQYVRWAESDADIFHKRDYVSPVFTIVYTNVHAVGSSRAVVDKCREKVEFYISECAKRGIEQYPRLITIFVVIQHVILIFTADTEDGADSEPFALAELDMSRKAYWLNTSIAIAISVMLARRTLMAHRDDFPELDVVEDDVDL